MREAGGREGGWEGGSLGARVIGGGRVGIWEGGRGEKMKVWGGWACNGREGKVGKERRETVTEKDGKT